jgi:tRNA (cytidine/uridine-2'-O-)-methyltransferase
MENSLDKYDQVNFHVVLIEPQIPNNTGNIGRLCVATKSRLHLVHPLGFEITDTRVKRAGLDYWPDLELIHHQNFENWIESVGPNSKIYFFSARGTSSFYDNKLNIGDIFVFGKEADGLSPEILDKYKERVVTIPFPGKVRSFNVANAVSMVLGEGIRQIYK